MADTTYLRREVEGHVRAQLTQEFGQPFTAEFLPLAPGGRHEFDAVAADRSVVASVKSASGLTAGGRIPSGKIKDCLAELYYLSLVEAPIRRLVLTTPEFYDISPGSPPAQSPPASTSYACRCPQRSRRGSI